MTCALLIELCEGYEFVLVRKKGEQGRRGGPREKKLRQGPGQATSGVPLQRLGDGLEQRNASTYHELRASATLAVLRSSAR